MAKHSLYPAFIKIAYTANAHPHHQVLPVNADPTAVGASFTIPTRAGGAVDWQTAVNAWANLIKTLYGAGDSVDTAELYNLEATTGPADFLQGMVVGVNGTGGGTTAPYAQLVMPFKGLAAAAVRPSFMETQYPPDVRTPYAALDANQVAIADFVLSVDNWVACRGGGFPSVSLGSVSKTNDQLRKRYFNP